jgi:hypothetical protein
MRRTLLTGILAAVSCLLLLPSVAYRLRQQSIIFSQPKISQTAFPVLPADDLLYRYPHQLIPTPLKPAPAWPGFE